MQDDGGWLVHARDHRVKRRDLIISMVALAARPTAVLAQKKARPVIGYLSSGSPGPNAPFLAAFHQGLGETGYNEGQNLAVEYRWAEGRLDRLPAFAISLADLKVDAIVATPSTAAIAAKNATSTIPIVFISGVDPIAAALVSNISRPNGNLTGISFLSVELLAKQIELLSELIPLSTAIGVLVNPTNSGAERMIGLAEEAAQAKRLRLSILKAATEGEIDVALASFAQKRSDPLVIGADPYFFNRRLQLAQVASRLAIPAAAESREFAASGLLLSYGTDLKAVFHQLGTYTGRILNGANPTDLPVQQPTKFELVINLKTAKALDLTVPQSLLVRANEVIE
jgi:putative ABC transport system substrate-binding protein